VDGSLRGPIGHLAARSQRENPRGSSLTIPLRSLGAEFGHLKLTWKRRKTLSSGLFRVLEQLCAIAAAAERGFAGQAIGFEPASPRESVSLLDGVLAYSLAQAQRRNEPVSLVFVAVDRLTAIRDLLGESLAEAAVERVERAIRATVRVSDVVARVDSGRVAVLLPNASAENALRVAETIRSAVARVGEPSTTMPILTASLGVATRLGM
jgi:diguanylate cyclase (GGDEF)-like protein